jgi:hypothetical protein
MGPRTIARTYSSLLDVRGAGRPLTAGPGASRPGSAEDACAVLKGASVAELPSDRVARVESGARRGAAYALVGAHVSAARDSTSAIFWVEARPRVRRTEGLEEAWLVAQKKRRTLRNPGPEMPRGEECRPYSECRGRDRRLPAWRESCSARPAASMAGESPCA